MENISTGQQAAIANCELKIKCMLQDGSKSSLKEVIFQELAPKLDFSPSL